MEISATMVKDLREKTGAGLMDCKKALNEAQGDVEKAIDWLRQKGIMKASAKASRAATEGAVESFVAPGHKVAALVEVNSETDFAARNDLFQALAKNVAEHVAAASPAVVKPEDGPGAALLTQPFFKDPSKTVATLVTDAVAKIGENLQARRFARFESTDGVIGSYIHMGGKIGVLVELGGATSDEAAALARDLAMHVAAASPAYARRADVDTSHLEREKDVQRAQLKEQGKPEAMWDKILNGKIDKFYKDVCAVEQIYVKDPEGKKSVQTVIDEAGKKFGAKLEFRRFVRFALGEGLEKKVTDFAAEVAATAGLKN